jgi:hypothetical protein
MDLLQRLGFPSKEELVMNLMTIEPQIEDMPLVTEPDELRLSDLSYVEIEAPEA